MAMDKENLAPRVSAEKEVEKCDHIQTSNACYLVVYRVGEQILQSTFGTNKPTVA